MKMNSLQYPGGDMIIVFPNLFVCIFMNLRICSIYCYKMLWQESEERKKGL